MRSACEIIACNLNSLIKTIERLFVQSLSFLRFCSKYDIMMENKKENHDHSKFGKKKQDRPSIIWIVACCRMRSDPSRSKANGQFFRQEIEVVAQALNRVIEELGYLCLGQYWPRWVFLFQSSWHLLLQSCLYLWSKTIQGSKTMEDFSAILLVSCRWNENSNVSHKWGVKTVKKPTKPKVLSQK